MKLAYLGTPGSFSYCASKIIEPDAESLGFTSFINIFIALQEGIVNTAIVPIENTLAGSIYENYDLLERYGFHIHKELNLRIEHALLVQYSTNDTTTIKTIYSHPKAIEQCQKFLMHLPNINTLPVSDTAEAARKVANSKYSSEVAAIASVTAAKQYKLKVLQYNIEDEPQNYTRFLEIKKQKYKINERVNKCSVLVLLEHKIGSLHLFLNVLKLYGCNMTKIESRPQPGKPFEYRFYIDFIFDEVHMISKILNELRRTSYSLRVLGMYRAAVTVSMPLK